MGDSADPFRLAIGVFHEPERLESAISDLLADNFVERDMCLVGMRQAFDRLLPLPVGEPGRAHLTGQLQPLSPLADDPEVVATAGDLLPRCSVTPSGRAAPVFRAHRRCRSCWRAPPTISGMAPSLCW